MNPTYSALIASYLQSQIPYSSSPSVQFEAISSIIIGSKQRRMGPIPAPEVQVAIRDIIRQSGKEIHFFIPWGSRKQAVGQTVDVMEVMALYQLKGLQSELKEQGITSHFHFRIEDMTDYWLFQNRECKEVHQYAEDFRKLVYGILGPNNSPLLESQLVDKPQYFRTAETNMAVFQRFLLQTRDLDSIRAIGWKGDIPQEQVDHYIGAYKGFWDDKPEKFYLIELARYFASSLTRVHLDATAFPKVPFINLAFHKAVPGSPMSPNRLFLRSLPQRCTNTNRSPWLAKGYFVIKEDNETCPKSAAHYETLDFQPNVTEMFGVKVQTDYLLQ